MDFTADDFDTGDPGEDPQETDAATSERGCGTQTEGGIYACCPLSPYGEPIEFFLIDPPRLEIPAHIKPRGTFFLDEKCNVCAGSGKGAGGDVLEQIAYHFVAREIANDKEIKAAAGKCINCFGRGTVSHVVDWVGSNNYPNVADFIEETRRLGMSRKLSPKLDFSRITPGSRQMFIHSRAHINAPAKVWKAELAYRTDEKRTGPHPKACPKGLHHPGDATEEHTMCARYYWQDVSKGEPVKEGERPVVRELACKGRYRALESIYDGLKDNARRMKYSPAFFLWLPIQRIDIIANRSNREQEGSAVKSATKAHVPVTVIDPEG